MISAATLWLISSNPALQADVLQALASESYRLRLMQEPQEAIAFSTHPFPDNLSSVMPEPLPAILPNTVPELVLLDAQIQDSTGLRSDQLCRQLRQQVGWQQVPIVMILPVATLEAKQQAFQAGAVDCLVVPLCAAEVQMRVRQWCRLHRLESQSEQQEERLQQVDQSLRLMLQALAHDLRNPVLGMQMVFRNLLACANPATTENSAVISLPRAFVERMVEGSDRHLSLIDALVDVHSEVTKPLSLNLEWFSPQSSIESWLNELQPHLDKNQATLSLSLATDLPLLQADLEQLRRVFRQLIENAISHNPPGVHLSVSAEAVENGVCFVVEDDGVGIAPDVGDRLFRLCQRGDDTGRTYGLGVGLYLCQRIVEAHGGDIRVMNRAEGGARFWFTLPQYLTSECSLESLESVHPTSLG